MDNYSDLTDYENPLKPNWRSSLLLLSSSSYRTDEYTYRTLNVITDEGLIMESNSMIPSFQFDSKIALVYGPNSVNILTIRTDVSNLNLFSGRKYMKLQLVIANTGGLIKFLTMLASFILSYLNHYFYIEKIFMNSITKYNKICVDKPLDFSCGKSEVKMIELKNNYLDYNLKNTCEDKNLPVKTIEKNEKKIGFEKVRYRKINICSLLCKNKSMSYVQKLDDYYKKEMDLLNLFLHIQNYKLIENIIYDEKSKRAKDYVFHINLINLIIDNLHSFKQDPIQFENEGNCFYRDILDIKNTEKVLNVNESLYHEFVKLKAI
jgi:hypothetical protein